MKTIDPRPLNKTSSTNMVSVSRRQTTGALTIRLTGIKRPSKLPTINAANFKRKPHHMPQDGDLDELLEDNDDDSTFSYEPPRKKFKINKNIVENGAVTIDLVRLSEQISSVPWEIRERIRNMCILGRNNNNHFINAFLSSRELQLHNTAMYRSIQEKEVVLTGKKFMYEFDKLHKAVIQIARKLKVVYITSDVPLSDKDINKRMRAHKEAVSEYIDYQTLHSFGCVLPEYCPKRPPPMVSVRPKMYPMAQPNYSSQYNSVLQACRKFISVNELTLDFVRHIEYNGNGRMSCLMDGYAHLVQSHVFAQTGYVEHAKAPFAAFDTGKLAAGGSCLKKLTLVLGQRECSYEESQEKALPSTKDLRMVMHSHPHIPRWQIMREFFKADIKVTGFMRFNPATHLPLIDFNMDKGRGVVSFKRAGYKGLELD